MTRSPSNALLRSLRRRLWLERGLTRLRAAVWAGSIALLALSCYSAFFSPVLPMLAVSTALAVVVVVAASAVFLRPSLLICARKGDRLFDTSSLLLTALEVSHRDKRSAAGRVVVQQADSAALELRGRLGDAWTAPPLSGFALTLVPLFASMVLLSFATVENGAAATPSAAESPLHAVEYELEDEDDLVELRNTIAEGPAQREPRSSESVAAQAPTDVEMSGETLPEESATSVAATGPGHGRDAGQSEAEPGAAVLQLEPADTAPFAAVNIERRGDAVGAEGGGEFAPAAARSAAADVLPAAAPASLSDWSALSPAQVAYARRYLEGMEADND